MDPITDEKPENEAAADWPSSIRPELVFSVLAVLISLLTLFVYIYQSNLMKTQQKMSVWPHLSLGPSSGEGYFKLFLINKGIGPALVKEVKIEVGGKPVGGIEEIIPDSLNVPFLYSSIWPGQVIMAGETIEVLKASHPAAVDYLVGLLNEDKVEIEICYCSVYGDCWTSVGSVVQESNCR